jgi:hypothetical protein
MSEGTSTLTVSPVPVPVPVPVPDLFSRSLFLSCL